MIFLKAGRREAEKLQNKHNQKNNKNSPCLLGLYFSDWYIF